MRPQQRRLDGQRGRGHPDRLVRVRNPDHAEAIAEDQRARRADAAVRSAGVLSTLVLARSAKQFQSRQQSKINKLESTIKARRVIEKAIRVLMDHQRLDERAAYEHMRTRATGLRVSVAEVAAMIVEASEAMEKLGLGALRPGPSQNN